MEKLPRNIAAMPAPTPAGEASPAEGAAAGPLRMTLTRAPGQEPGLPREDEKERLRKKAVRGLGKRAGGFVSQEVKSTWDVDSAGNRTLKSQIVTRKQSPPDLAAIIFTLTNLEGERWRSAPDAAGVPAQASEADGLSAIPEELLRSVLRYFPAPGEPSAAEPRAQDEDERREVR